MLNAENRTEQSTASAHQTISAILTVPADQNALSTRIVLGIRAVLETAVLILALVHVERTRNAKSPITFPFAPVKSHSLAILTALADLFQRYV